jgi:hypothetical protein
VIGRESVLSHLKKPTLNAVVGILHYITIGLMVFLIAYSLFMWLFTSRVWGLGGFFWSSWITFAFVYLGTAIFLRINGVSPAESFIISLTSTVSMIWLYQILYHFSFWDSWNYGKPPYLFLNGNTIFLNYGVISLTALSGYRYMKTNRWFWFVLVAIAVLWIFWITIGFPQYEFPKTLYAFAWPRIIMTNPYVYAFPLNAVTMFLLGTAYVLLYLPSRQKLALAKEGIKEFLIKRGFLDYNE